ncbi:hypothetical protein [Paenibacillus sp. FSL K6-1230]|uniref:hypothetical protein n=1 Tax=Paenibacillus sp. FSL K6-1230 TaxID=2921603 RepID=UPI0030F8D027
MDNQEDFEKLGRALSSLHAASSRSCPIKAPFTIISAYGRTMTVSFADGWQQQAKRIAGSTHGIKGSAHPVTSLRIGPRRN